VTAQDNQVTRRTAVVSATTDDARPISATDLHRALDRTLDDSLAADLVRRLRAHVGAEALTGGTAMVLDDLMVGWAIEAPGARTPPAVVAERGDGRYPLTRLAATDVYATAVTLPASTATRWTYEVDGERRGGGQVEVYAPHPDTHEQAGVPHGTVLPQPPRRSTVFAGTERAWSLYVPATYRATEPAAVMIFQDGVRFYQACVPVVFDNLIASGAMPPTIGIFLDPGVFTDTTASNRSVEYDTLSDQYARFLLEEVLPEVGERYALRHDAAGRAIAGISSGGICAFTAAWQRPDQFGKVLSHVGSFTNIASGPSLRDGGHNYPFLIRKLPPKPIRVSLQAGEQDLNNAHGNWWLANLQMADALAFAGYDHQVVTGPGFHSLAHGRAILPDSLRWLWR
jgi:enterochelin esterase family protein